MADIQLLMIIGISVIFAVVIGAILLNQILQARKKSSLEDSAHASPSSFDSESKTKMMSRLDRRESMLRREQILEGGTLPELSELVIHSPTFNEKIDAKEVDVRGKTAIKSIVWINNQAAFVDVDGSFIGSVPIFKGKNNLEVVVIGPYGRVITSNVPINCVSKDAANRPSNYDYLLPQHDLEIISGEVAEREPIDFSQQTSESGIPSAKMVSFSKANSGIIVDESEIDPSVLAALKGDPIGETSMETAEEVPIDSITPEVPELEIPPIPDVLGPEEEDQIPEIPDVDLEEEDSEVVVESDDDSIDESVKVIEEVIKSDSQEIDEEKFPLDEMMPVDTSTRRRVEEKDELDSLQLDEFKPLKQDFQYLEELKVETKKQKLDDERSTEILQHTGFVTKEDGDQIQLIKIEKRIEKIKEKWYSTIGLVNVSNIEFSKIEFSEYISNTLELKEDLPSNVEEPIIDTLPDGVKINWTITNVKPQMKIFITYVESVNPLKVVPKGRTIPTLSVKK